MKKVLNSINKDKLFIGRKSLTKKERDEQTKIQSVKKCYKQKNGHTEKNESLLFNTKILFRIYEDILHKN